MDVSRKQSPQLGLWDAVSIIVGIIIGVGIFKTPSSILSQIPYPSVAIGSLEIPTVSVSQFAWACGGFLSLVGAYCFAELSSTYPQSGGEYVYLTRGFGPLMGYLFGWAQLTIIRPGSIGALACIFAEYAQKLRGLESWQTTVVAIGSIVVLTLINIVGVTFGKHTQNLLSAIKVLGLFAIVVVGFVWGLARDRGISLHFLGPGIKPGWFSSIMILIMWTYAGWHEAAYVVSEVKNPTRTVPRAFVIGTTLVTALYLLVSEAFYLALGYAGIRSQAPATDVVALALPDSGPKIVSVLIMISALGAINGMIFTTSRICTAFAGDHRLFRSLSAWHPFFGTPVRALLVTGGISVAMILGISAYGEAGSIFEDLVDMTAAAFWLFFLLTGICLFVLRRKDRDIVRPFPVPLYPVLPFIFCCACAFMMYGAIRYKPVLSMVGFAIVLVGIPFYYIANPTVRDGAGESQAE